MIVAIGQVVISRGGSLQLSLKSRVVRWRAQQQLGFHHKKSKCSAASVNSGSNNIEVEDGSPSVAGAPSDELFDNAQSSYLELWGVAASLTAASLYGLDTINNCRNHPSWNNNQGVYATRGYHSTSATCCESNNNHSNPSNKSKSSAGDNSNKKSESFFDWASEYASSKSNKENDQVVVGMSNNDSNNKEDESSPIQTPEDLLTAMGILGGMKSGRSGHDSKDEIGNNSQKQNVEEDDNNNLKGMMQKVLFKFDEFQSTLPKPSQASAEAKEEDHPHDNINSQPDEGNNNTENSSSNIFSDFLSFANNASLFTGKTSAPPPDIDELIQQAQNIANYMSSSSLSDNNNSSSQSQSYSSGFLSQVLYFQQNAQAIRQAFESSVGPHLLSNINVKDLPVAELHYYLEHQDSIKTPSWKRRIHRFQRDVEVMKVEELNEALILSELSYADGVDEIREGLESLYNNGKDNKKPQWELLFCDTKSKPNEPSHFLAIQKNASPYDDALHVLMVVRGTKSMSDLITDAMMEASDYKYALPGGDVEDNIIQGKAHSGMVFSGKHLVERHQKLLSTLLKLSKKRKLEITLIGHSLGAGAATIAAMEWNSKSFEGEKKDAKSDGGSGKNDIQVSAHVIGFGCPALLSQPLSLATKDYVTTVIADADFIPRMSGATLVNLLLDVTNFDYRQQAERDVEQALRELQNRFSGTSAPLPSTKPKSKLAFNIDEDDIQTVMGYVHRGLEKVATTSASTAEKSTKTQMEEEGGKTDTSKEEVEKMQPILFPPGECIHFYRDGSSISGTYVPCNFFNEPRAPDEHSNCQD